MIEKLDYSIDMAVALFAQARPPGIYKQDYLNDLFEMYIKPDEREFFQVYRFFFYLLIIFVVDLILIHSLKVPIAPPVPSWKDENSPNPSTSGASAASNFEEDLSDDEESDGKEDDEKETGESNGGSRNGGSVEKRPRDGTSRPRKNPKRRRAEDSNLNAKFADPKLAGIETCTDLDEIDRVRTETQKICGWYGKGFPGAQPVSMDQQNVRFLVERKYMVSWKADGTR